MQSPRRHWTLMVVASLVCVGALAVPGAEDLVLYLMPLLLIGGMLMSGRYVGEEALLALRHRCTAAPRRAPRRLPRPAPARALASLLARGPRLERGPPAGLALTA
jgi:hypothetical protein